MVTFTEKILNGKLYFCAVIRTLQQNHFTGEYKCLSKEKEIQSNSKILSLRPQIYENGLQRSSERLENVEYINYDVKYPFILHTGNWITKLIVRHCNERGLHISGINHTLVQLT